MTKQKNANTLRISYLYDLRCGGRATVSRFLPSAGLFIIGCLIYYMRMPEILRINGLSDRLGFLDTWIYLFRGNAALPLVWMTIQLYIQYIVLFYPVQNLGGNGVQFLIRSKQRESWWTSKLLWTYTMVLLYYVLLAAVVGVITAAAGGTGVNGGSIWILGSVADMDAGTVLLVLIGPVLSSLACASLELLISAAASPVYGFLAVLLLDILTVFFYTPFLFGNVSMLDRNSALGFQAINYYEAAGVAVAVCLACWLIGKWIIAKKDILANDESRI